MEFPWVVSLFSDNVYWNIVLLDLNERLVHELFWSQDRKKKCEDSSL